MVTVTAITVYNAAVDYDRREYFKPTVISGASFIESRGSSQSNGMNAEAISYKLRIPADADTIGKEYVPEAAYKAMDYYEASNHWTLRKGDYIALGAHPGTELDARDLPKDLIRIVEYADNTIRGSAAVRHWRIGGA